MQPVLFEILSIKIYAYGLFMAIGIMATVVISLHLARKVQVSADAVYDLSFMIIIFSILGARLLFVLLNMSYFAQHPWEIFLLNRGGLVYYGGLAGGFFSAFFYLKKNQLPLWKTGDIICTALPLGQAFGRIGCFLNGCCFGKPGHETWCLVYPIGTAPFEHYEDFLTIHPVQLYNAATTFLIFLILYTVFEDRKFPGLNIVLYGALYSVARLFTEFYRGDVPLYGPFTLAQYISLIVFTLSMVLYRHLANKHKAENQFP